MWRPLVGELLLHVSEDQMMQFPKSGLGSKVEKGCDWGAHRWPTYVIPPGPTVSTFEDLKGIAFSTTPASKR